MYQPDFVLIRNIAYSMYPHDHRNQLYGFMHGNIPAMNSFHSFYMCLERPLIHGALLEVQKRLGDDEFPLIEQNYYSNWEEMVISPSYPLVTKIGHVHAGLGKMRIQNSEDFEDLRSVVAIHNDYATAERYYEVDYDIRLVKIGDHYHGHKRYTIGWKKNRGSGTDVVDIEVDKKYKGYLDEASTIFGGLDMFALDLIHTKDGHDYILELNASAMGLNPYHRDEQMREIRDLALKKIETIFS